MEDVNNAGFTNCYYSIKGMRMVDGERKMIEKSDIRAPPGKVTTFKSTGEEVVEWLYLTITTRPLG